MSDETYSGNIQTLPRAVVNGTAQEGTPSRDMRGDDITTRAPWLGLTEPYDNLEVRVWLSYPQEVADILTVPQDDTPEQQAQRGLEFLKTVVLAHRGANGGPWRLDGKELPSPDTDEFWQIVPNELAMAIGERFWDEVKRGNESRALRRRKLKSSRRR